MIIFMFDHRSNKMYSDFDSESDSDSDSDFDSDGILDLCVGNRQSLSQVSRRCTHVEPTDTGANCSCVGNWRPLITG